MRLAAMMCIQLVGEGGSVLLLRRGDYDYSSCLDKNPCAARPDAAAAAGNDYYLVLVSHLFKPDFKYVWLFLLLFNEIVHTEKGSDRNHSPDIFR
jgi:hypothetical protein